MVVVVGVLVGLVHQAMVHGSALLTVLGWVQDGRSFVVVDGLLWGGVREVGGQTGLVIG